MAEWLELWIGYPDLLPPADAELATFDDDHKLIQYGSTSRPSGILYGPYPRLRVMALPRYVPKGRG